ncbi:hypothetical protein EJ06DRAFT_206202 [Trichodelitschia bisporula]|uniref:Uncharacterized protein n=1 Tax=Trichodelitschia bisporula TaxID=703511 RepID=A0A6G1I8T5_9PEZI|nr:hypothetical protein EJ06DRAFT_206202 [Trichodelitschia bisporula]
MFLDDIMASKWNPNLHPATAARQPRSPLRLPPQADMPRPRDVSASSTEHKRNSRFGMRPKSSQDGYRSRTPSVPPAGSSSRRSSIAEAPVQSMPPVEPEGFRSLLRFRRSKKGKSSGSNLRSSSPVGVRDGQRAVSGKEQRHDAHMRTPSHEDRELMDISAPYGFQHVAKIEKELRRQPPPPPPPPELPVNQADIFAEFHAFKRGNRRAGPPPSDNAQPLQSKKRPPPLRPKRSDEMLENDLLSPPLASVPLLRSTRSAEVVTNARARARSGIPLLQSTPTPPRRSSRRPVPLEPFSNNPSIAQQLPRVAAQNVVGNELTLSGEWDHLLPLYDSQSPPFNPANLGTASNTRGVQAPESAPLPPTAPIFSPPLEQVPEEPEGTLSHRQSAEYTSPSIRHAKSTPLLSRSGSKVKGPPALAVQPPPLPSPRTERPLSQGSDTLGDPNRRPLSANSFETTLMAYIPMSRHQHSKSRDTAISWEEDIDYCYENAAEATCEFDWSNISHLDDADSDGDLYSADDIVHAVKSVKDKDSRRRQQSNSLISTSGSEGSGARRLSDRKNCIPELDYRSTHSASTNSVGALTPLDKFTFPSNDILRPLGPTQAKKDANRSITSPQLLPLELKLDLNADQLYEELLAKRFSDDRPHQLSNDRFEAPSRPSPKLDMRRSIENARLSLSRTKTNDSMTSRPLPPTSAPAPTTPPSSSRALESPTSSLKTPTPSTGHRSDLSVNTIITQLRSSTMLDSPPTAFPPSPSLPPPPPPPPKSPLPRHPIAGRPPPPPTTSLPPIPSLLPAKAAAGNPPTSPRAPRTPKTPSSLSRGPRTQPPSRFPGNEVKLHSLPFSLDIDHDDDFKPPTPPKTPAQISASIPLASLPTLPATRYTPPSASVPPAPPANSLPPPPRLAPPSRPAHAAHSPSASFSFSPATRLAESLGAPAPRRKVVSEGHDRRFGIKVDQAVAGAARGTTTPPASPRAKGPRTSYTLFPPAAPPAKQRGGMVLGAPIMGLPLPPPPPPPPKAAGRTRFA